jgi:hypothetical protein
MSCPDIRNAVGSAFSFKMSSKRDTKREDQPSRQLSHDEIRTDRILHTNLQRLLLAELPFIVRRDPNLRQDVVLGQDEFRQQHVEVSLTLSRRTGFERVLSNVESRSPDPALQAARD